MPRTKLESLAVDGSRFFKKQSRKAKKSLSDFDSRNMEVALNLYNYVEDTPGMSRAILAERLGISQAYLSKLINGQINLTLNTIEKYERILGILLLPRARRSASENKFRVGIPTGKIFSTESFSIESHFSSESTFNAPENGNQLQICRY